MKGPKGRSLCATGTVLVVTTKTDITADLVVLEFQRRGTPYVRFNTEDFPQNAQVSWVLEAHGFDGYIRLPHVELSLQEVSSVWYRRPAPPVIAETVRSPCLRDFAQRESLEALSGLWRTMDCFWMSHPDAINFASYKARQLETARKLGFNVPRTLISNSSETVKKFHIECGQVIAKPLFSGEIECGSDRRIVFTTPITGNDLAATASLELAPTLFQEYVRKEIELRVTVIGNKVLAASINSQEVDEGIHDWRRAPSGSLSFQSFQLPMSVSDKCARLVASFGLTFGTIDMVKTPEGSYVFLELNPNGQWGWLESPTGDSYAGTIATLLERGRILQ